jgi:hypothetical protein
LPADCGACASTDCARSIRAAARNMLFIDIKNLFRT